MTLDEAIERYTSNAEYERADGSLQGCLEFKQLVEWIKELKRLREQTRWIPVSKRLPQELDYVLCCDKDGYMTIGYIRISKLLKECWCFVDDEIDIDVVAWMPLPQPYEPKVGE